MNANIREAVDDWLRNETAARSNLKYGDIYVGEITDMSFLLCGNKPSETSSYYNYCNPKAAQFNGNISSWQVENVQTMEGMFSYATSFNGDLSKWHEQ